ncbi:hypothetical protein HK098_002127 [Nowakowskiella sp. JEL0407]|nr:hypothetical protein HK098_002127 [Nowakowskiella sp. JEL0407]
MHHDAKLTYTIESFYTMLDDPILFEEFKQYCVHDFSLESALFLEALKNVSREAMANKLLLTPKKEIRIINTKSEDNIQTQTETTNSLEVPSQLIPKYVEILRIFILPGAAFEINISSEIQTEILQAFQTANLIDERMESIYGDSLKIAHQSKLEKAILLRNVFDAAKSHIVQLSFMNTFDGFLNEQKNKTVSSKETTV